MLAWIDIDGLRKLMSDDKIQPSVVKAVFAKD
jgi:hypothetical protein